MLTHLRPALVTVLFFTLLLGLVVPLGFTWIAGLAFPAQAGGSLIRDGDRVVGSALLGQLFTTDRYFHPRPSATTEADPENEARTRERPYNGAASAASQLGPTSAALRDAIQQRLGEARGVPADAVTASGSGLDPHITPENAARQVTRVAAARGLPEARIRQLLAAQLEDRDLGFLGQPRVNVLLLNRALDAVR